MEVKIGMNLKDLEFNQSLVQRYAYTPGKTASFPEFATCCFAALSSVYIGRTFFKIFKIEVVQPFTFCCCMFLDMST